MLRLKVPQIAELRFRLDESKMERFSQLGSNDWTRTSPSSTVFQTGKRLPYVLHYLRLRLVFIARPPINREYKTLGSKGLWKNRFLSKLKGGVSLMFRRWNLCIYIFLMIQLCVHCSINNARNRSLPISRVFPSAVSCVAFCVFYHVGPHSTRRSPSPASLYYRYSRFSNK